jgi:hypothetical protein
MSVRFGWMGLAAVGMVGLVVTSVDAQTAVITDAQFKAAAGGNPATAEPKGTFSYPGTGKTYRPFVDYGYLDNGEFKADLNVSAGGPGQPEVVTKQGGGDSGNWSSKNAHNLTNPKAGLYARVRVQQFNNTTNAWDFVPGTQDLELVPVPPGGGGDDNEPLPLSIEEYAVSQFSSRRGARGAGVVVTNEEKRV